MSRPSSWSGQGHVALAVLVLTAAVAVACNEESKAVPANCATPLELFDIAHAGAPSDDNQALNAEGNCVTEVGHGISYFGTQGGSTTTAGSSSGGKAGSAGGGKANVGSGGVPSDGGAGAGSEG